MGALVIGVDPGLTTGVFAVESTTRIGGGRRGDPIAMQIHGSEGVIPTMQTILARKPEHEQVLAVEQFVVSNRAARSSTPEAGRVTRALIAELGDLGVHVFLRNASLVKTWATDKRLEAAGLLDATKGMGHARDASRHALYAAVHCGITTDPLSPKAAAR
jgi:hypothetical protein